MPACVLPFPAARQRRPVLSPLFEVAIVRRDGTRETLQRRGGSSIQHAVDGMDRAGAGGVVRVRVVEEALS